MSMLLKILEPIHPFMGGNQWSSPLIMPILVVVI